MSVFVSVRDHTLFLRAIPNDPVVLDVGANRGEFSRQLSARYPGRYRLFEANPALIASLEDGRWEVVHAAVGADSGQVTLNIAQNDEGSSILRLPDTSAFGCTVEDEVVVPQMSLGAILAATPEPVDILKLDIEGAEVPAFRSVTDDQFCQLRQVSVEFHSHKSFGFDLSAETEAILDRFRAQGFLAFDFSMGRRIDVLLLSVSGLGLSKRSVRNLAFRHAAGSPRRVFERIRRHLRATER